MRVALIFILMFVLYACKKDVTEQQSKINVLKVELFNADSLFQQCDSVKLFDAYNALNEVKMKLHSTGDTLDYILANKITSIFEELEGLEYCALNYSNTKKHLFLQSQRLAQLENDVASGAIDKENFNQYFEKEDKLNQELINGIKEMLVETELAYGTLKENKTLIDSLILMEPHE